jgi:hypothetical protein
MAPRDPVERDLLAAVPRDRALRKSWFAAKPEQAMRMPTAPPMACSDVAEARPPDPLLDRS